MRPSPTASEREITALDRYWHWRSERPGYTMFDAYLGRLLLTETRLLFLSTGSNGILQQLFWGIPATDHLTVGALANRGSFSLWLERIELTALSRRRDFSWFLVVKTKSGISTFMSKTGFDRERLAEFQVALEQQRAAAIGG